MCDEHDEQSGESNDGPVTVMALAIFRGVKESEGGGYTMGAFEDVGLPMLGGCQRCGASIVAYNACPSTTGYLMCASGCIDGYGYDTVEQANMALFPEEYAWQGVNKRSVGQGEATDDDESNAIDSTIPRWRRDL